MKCPKCQYENREGAKFCNKCGHKFDLTCPECGQIDPPESKFCSECGFNFKQKHKKIVFIFQIISWCFLHKVFSNSSLSGMNFLLTKR